MNEEKQYLHEFGRFRLDVRKKMLWHDGLPVSMPLKELELLCVLIENRGELVTKETLLDTVWEDSYVEESNLSRHIYLLRKTFKDFGEDQEIIQNVPRRGYRFTGEVSEVTNGEVIIEKHTSTQTLIEIVDDREPSGAGEHAEKRQAYLSRRSIFSVAAIALVLATGFIFVSNYRSAPATAADGAINSIGILPVKSFSAGNEDEELRIRITDALITRLGGSSGIAVRPTSAVLHFTNSDADPLELGRHLKVDAVLDARVQRESGRLRVTLQLIRVRNGEHLWSEQFDGQADQILSLQDNISAKVLQSLAATNQVQPALARRLTDSPEAYEAYLKGRYFWNKRDADSLRRSVEYFTKAAEIDPQFSEAYAGIADSQHLLFNYNIDVRPEIIVIAKDNLKRALDLKPDSADALITLGSIRMGYDWDWNGAEDAFKLAVAAEPNSAIAHIRYGTLLVRTRRFEEAKAEFQKSLELDPLSLIGKMNLAMTQFCAKDFAAAEIQFRNVLEIDEKVAGSHWILSRTLWQLGRKDEAIAEIFLGLKNDGNETLGERIRARSASSTPEEAIRLLLYEWRAVPPETNKLNMAYLSTYINDSDKAVYWLEKSFEERHPWTAWISAYPEFESLYNKPGYQKLLQQMNMMY